MRKFIFTTHSRVKRLNFKESVTFDVGDVSCSHFPHFDSTKLCGMVSKLWHEHMAHVKAGFDECHVKCTG